MRDQIHGHAFAQRDLIQFNLKRGTLRFDPRSIRKNAERFAADKFRDAFTAFVEEKWNAFRA